MSAKFTFTIVCPDAIEVTPVLVAAALSAAASAMAKTGERIDHAPRVMSSPVPLYPTVTWRLIKERS